MISITPTPETGQSITATTFFSLLYISPICNNESGRS
jgi:hypothetical protein